MKIEGKEYRTIWFDSDKKTVKIIDQTKLPHHLIIKDLKIVKDAINAIKKIEIINKQLRNILGRDCKLLSFIILKEFILFFLKIFLIN